MELIEKGVLGTASEEERKLIDSRMSDQEFRKTYEETNKLISSMRLHQRQNVLKLMRDEEVRIRATEKRSETNMVSWRYWAAAAAVLLVGLFFVFNLTQQPSDIFTRYYEDLPSLNTSQSRGIDEGVSKAAFQLYRDGRVDDALSIVNDHLSKNPDDIEVVFLRGLIFLKDHKFENAVDDLARIESPAGRWYLALSYVGLKDYAEAKNTLQMIMLESDNEFRLKAGKLLEELQKLETSAP